MDRKPFQVRDARDGERFRGTHDARGVYQGSDRDARERRVAIRVQIVIFAI